MLQHEMHYGTGVLVLKPQGPLAAGDFSAVTREADNYIESHGALNGLMVCVKKFPGWKDFRGFWAHLRFVRDHHRKIKKVAFVSNSRMLEFIACFAKYVVHPEAKYFKFKHKDTAREWIGES